MTITREQLIENLKTAQAALAAWEIDPDEYTSAYDDMLDESYSLAGVGGPFSGMSASRVLQECDETAYRCGLDDYCDRMDPSECADYVELEEAVEQAESALEAYDDAQDALEDAATTEEGV